jgi:hypothetical protein
MQSFVRTSSIRRKVTIATLTGLSLFTLASCEGDDELPTKVRIAQAPSASVSPKASTLSIGETKQLTAEIRDGNGTVLNLPVTWTSSDPDIVTVNANGLVTAIAAGNGSVVASASNGARSSGSFTVLASVANLEIVGSNALLAVGSSRTLSVTPLDANGQPVAATVSAWKSSNPSIATVTPIGSSVDNAARVTAVGEGNVTITATVNGMDKTITIPIALLTASLTVTPSPINVPLGGPGQLTAVARDGNGTALTRTIEYSISTPNGTTVSGSGLVSVPGTGWGSSVITAKTTDLGGTVSTQVLVNPLKSGTTVTAVGGVTDDDYFFVFNVPAGTTSIVITMGGGTGDPDVFLYRPDGSLACSSERAAGALETCTAAAPFTAGLWTFEVYGFSEFAGWTITTTVVPTPP